VGAKGLNKKENTMERYARVKIDGHKKGGDKPGYHNIRLAWDNKTIFTEKELEQKVNKFIVKEFDSICEGPVNVSVYETHDEIYDGITIRHHKSIYSFVLNIGDENVLQEK
jgi:hypothetical protein